MFFKIPAVFRTNRGGRTLALGLVAFCKILAAAMFAEACTITSAAWQNSAPVREAETATIVLNGQNCVGTEVTIVIREDDSAGINFDAAQDLGIVLRRRKFETNSLAVPFRSIWIKDSGDSDQNSELVFRVTPWKATNVLATGSNELVVLPPLPQSLPGLIGGQDIQYMGGFKLPAQSSCNSTDDFTWMKGPEAYYPGGDAGGPADGYPGSLFGVGHAHCGHAWEVNIPAPVISAAKQMSDLPSASILQAPQNITSPIWSAGGEDKLHAIEYLPPLSQLGVPHLVINVGKHFEYTRQPRHGWTSLNLSSPAPQGPWFVGTAGQVDHINTNEYNFKIDQSWVNQNLPGKRLATGRHREGQIANGPVIVAFGHGAEGSTPSSNAELPATPLLLYRGPEMNPDQLNNHCWDDEWTGGAWVNVGGRKGVMIVGTKTWGSCWYGWRDGTIQGQDCDGGGRPSCESLGYGGDNRGYSGDYYQPMILIYDPEDFARVVRGEMQPYQPQPYAWVDLGNYMFDRGTFDDPEVRPGGVAYDEVRGLLYVMEGLNQETKRPVHVFKIGTPSSDTVPPAPPSNFRIVTQ